ncbi:hypothetical protein VHEMI10726 [[Torrubiella] hemipterigena]|uniref:Uncharacterized protein n=1 Tax=[Torrubiella] hemipterigena TaxID=1531966 RepID=A0A0A1TJG8_9HYPO|nr:hypothetical protein VHEMI10726 [[Torrubiella] hemipterigena]
MTSGMNFEPLWTEGPLIATSQDAVCELYRSATEMLRACQHISTTSCTASATGSDSFYLAKALLEHGDRSNMILDKILDTSDRQNMPVLDLMKNLIIRWYLCTLPALARAKRARVTDVLGVVEGQSEDESANSRLKTLGIWSLLFCSKARTEKQGICDGQASAAEGAVALIHLVYAMQYELIADEPMISNAILCIGEDAVSLYLKLMRRIHSKARKPRQERPGSVFGASNKYVRMSRDGRSLKVQDGQGHWTVAPSWHPCRTIPGSSWNKFLRNAWAPRFGSNAQQHRLCYNVPDSALTLSDTFVNYYHDLQSRFDQSAPLVKCQCTTVYSPVRVYWLSIPTIRIYRRGRYRFAGTCARVHFTRTISDLS